MSDVSHTSTESNGQTVGGPAGPAPHVGPALSPDTPSGVGQMPAESSATVNGTAAKLSVTAWLLFGGLVIAAIGIFFPWQSVSYSPNGLGNLVASNNSALLGSARFAVLLVIAVAVWLAWPARSGNEMSDQRLTGLTVVVFLLVADFALAFYGVYHNNSVNAAGSGEDFSAGLGLLVYTAAVSAVVVGTVRVWMHRSGTKEPAS